MTANNFSSNTPTGVLFLDLASELASFQQCKPWPSGLYSRLLLKAEDLRLVLIALDAGAKMKEHHAEETVSIHALQGMLCVNVEGQVQKLHAGQILTLGPGIKLDVEAGEDSAFLLTISWPTSAKPQALQHKRDGS